MLVAGQIDDSNMANSFQLDYDDPVIESNVPWQPKSYHAVELDPEQTVSGLVYNTSAQQIHASETYPIYYAFRCSMLSGNGFKSL